MSPPTNLDQSKMVSDTTSPPPHPSGPSCSRCGARGGKLSRLITRSSNRNGNAGRPYLKCLPCAHFITFADARGTHDVNLVCHCNRPSRLQVAGKLKGRGLHYVCSDGTCDFYDIAADPKSDGKQIKLTEDLVDSLAALQLI